MVSKPQPIYQQKLVHNINKNQYPPKLPQGFDFDILQTDDSLFLELKGGPKLVHEMIPVICVRSFAKFPPAAVKLEFPTFLNNVARVDWTNQNTFDVIVQRHEILIQEMEREEREFKETVKKEERMQLMQEAIERGEEEGEGTGAGGDEVLELIDDDELQEDGLPKPHAKEDATTEATKQESDKQAAEGFVITYNLFNLWGFML